MAFDFASCPDRRGTGAIKWDRWGALQATKGPATGSDIIPMWVADADFASPPCVVDALASRVSHGVFGYTSPSRDVAAAAAAWLGTRHGWAVAPESVVFVPGVVTGMNMFTRCVTSAPSDAHIVPIPSYPPFLSAPANCGSKLQTVEMRQEADGRFVLDSEALERVTNTNTKSFILCQPHNPTGRIFSKEELAMVANHCIKHGLYLLSDEIWADLTLTGKHIPFALCPEAAPLMDRVVTLYAASKTFNIAGLSCAIAVIPNPDLRKKFIAAGTGIVPHCNPLGLTASHAAWSQGAPWLDCLLSTLRTNQEAIAQAIKSCPKLAYHPPEGTYLAWIDATKWSPPLPSTPNTDATANPKATATATPSPTTNATAVTSPAKWALEWGVGVQDGADFGVPGWMRLNFACPPSMLSEALARLTSAFS
ncbi:pyridoxal phosphate-dependent aminotransferase [Pelomyxa schiedti]|nr:pyridoxal phosphate-dependent aminotransferase [Pelomyxa schiedti]